MSFLCAKFSRTASHIFSLQPWTRRQKDILDLFLGNKDGEGGVILPKIAITIPFLIFASHRRAQSRNYECDQKLSTVDDKKRLNDFESLWLMISPPK